MPHGSPTATSTAAADERIERSIDVMQQQALRVSRPSTAPLPRSMKWCAACPIRTSTPHRSSLHARLERIQGVMPQVQTIMIIGRDGRPLASSRMETVLENADFSQRDYFIAEKDQDTGTYVSDLRSPRLPGNGNDFFVLSHRLDAADGSFNGIIAVSIRPNYFENFYGMVVQTPGSFYSMVRVRRRAPGALPVTIPAMRGNSSRTACSRSRSARARKPVSDHRQAPRSTAFPAAWAFASSKAFRSMRSPASRPARSRANGCRRSAPI